jgi:hypothetical protein
MLDLDSTRLSMLTTRESTITKQQMSVAVNESTDVVSSTAFQLPSPSRLDSTSSSPLHPPSNGQHGHHLPLGWTNPSISSVTSAVNDETTPATATTAISEGRKTEDLDVQQQQYGKPEEDRASMTIEPDGHTATLDVSGKALVLSSSTNAMNYFLQKIHENEKHQSLFLKFLFHIDYCWRGLYDPVTEFARMGISVSSSTSSGFKNGLTSSDQNSAAVSYNYGNRWRISFINKNYDLCSTYPSVLAVPASISDETMLKAAKYRSKNRLPTLSWLSSSNGCSITRSSQPMSGIINARNNDDERILLEISRCSMSLEQRTLVLTSSTHVSKKAAALSAMGTAGMIVSSTWKDLSPTTSEKRGKDSIVERESEKGRILDDTDGLERRITTASNASSPQNNYLNDSPSIRPSVGEPSYCASPLSPSTGTSPFLIIDARPLLNAYAQQAVGKGYEKHNNYENTHLLFMDIPNIHAVRKSFEMIEESIFDDVALNKNIENWKDYLFKILLAVNRIVYCISKESISILIHCSDGWDRTSQLTSLSMLLLDSYYRTLDGFIVLIEKEWISFGHKFHDRLGWSQSSGWKDEEKSPVFFQWLDAIHQYLLQFPTAFEFNENLLLFLSEHLTSGLFTNFFFNNEYELKEAKPWQYSLSIWSVILANRSFFTSSTYLKVENPLIPVISRNNTVLWSKYFLKSYNNLWLYQWLYYNDTEIKGKKDEDVNSWLADHSLSECIKCASKFTMFRRRHHCR